MWQLDLMTGCMWLITTIYSRVSVFNENRKYIMSFGKRVGKRGNKDGEFSGPRAVAVRDDGYVFVSDTYNNRVQIFK